MINHGQVDRSRVILPFLSVHVFLHTIGRSIQFNLWQNVRKLESLSTELLKTSEASLHARPTAINGPHYRSAELKHGLLWYVSGYIQLCWCPCHIPFTNHCNESEVTDSTTSYCTLKLSLLRRNITSCPTSTKVQCFKMLVRPAIDYASPARDPHTTSNITVLEVVLTDEQPPMSLGTKGEQIAPPRWQCREWEMKSNCYSGQDKIMLWFRLRAQNN